MPSDSLYNTSSCDLQDLQITDSMPNTDQTEINSSSSNPLESQNFSHSAALSSNESSGSLAQGSPIIAAHNNHPMITRSKSRIFKPRTPFIGYL